MFEYIIENGGRVGKGISAQAYSTPIFILNCNLDYFHFHFLAPLQGFRGVWYIWTQGDALG